MTRWMRPPTLVLGAALLIVALVQLAQLPGPPSG